MDLNILISQFFTDEEVKKAFTSIWGTVENGGYPITKHSVIDEFDKPLQRICDFINALQNYINNLIATRNNPTIVITEGCERDIVSKPSLPSNLDEAAEDFAKKDWIHGGVWHDAVKQTFKAGAEWAIGRLKED